ncbi:MAG: multiprotein-bridging factor 1 family protein [Solirubrobacterales bacterium]
MNGCYHPRVDDLRARHRARDLPEVLRRARVVIDCSQRELARRSSVPQTAISRFERGRLDALTIDQLDRLAVALGGAATVGLQIPFLARRARQRDRVHARCVAFVAAHLARHGWEVATEVAIQGRSGPGWIDILAFHRPSATLLVIEVKTEIHDLGEIQRTLDWYESNARPAARAKGWPVTRVCGALLVLATRAADERARENRDLIRLGFPGDVDDLIGFVADPSSTPHWQRVIASIDPLARSRRWLRPLAVDRRRRPSPHADYAAVAVELERLSAAHRRRRGR